MKINHLSLAVPDVESTAIFMERFFEFKILENKGGIIAILKGEDNFILVLTTLKQGEASYPADFHFGFILKNEEEVLSIYKKLLAGGNEIPRPPSKIRSSFAFYFHIPGGIMAEVSCDL